MTWDRFDKISQYFDANDRSQMPFNAQGKPVDKLYLVRPILDTVLNQRQDDYIPYRDVSVGEAMIAYQGRSGGRRSRLVRPFEKNLNLAIIVPT